MRYRRPLLVLAVCAVAFGASNAPIAQASPSKKCVVLGLLVSSGKFHIEAGSCEINPEGPEKGKWKIELKSEQESGEYRVEKSQTEFIWDEEIMVRAFKLGSSYFGIQLCGSAHGVLLLLA